MEVWKMRGEAKSRIISKGNRYKVVISLFGIFAFIALLTVCPITAYAHAPKEVTLIYNEASKTLEVTIVHESASPTWHYIKKVEITKNGTSIGVNDYKSQPDKTKFVYSYKEQAVQNDVLEVTATCNIHGSKTVKLTVGK
jgi:desulfoferrodoxin (superoxide reductase-like protein)